MSCGTSYMLLMQVSTFFWIIIMPQPPEATKALILYPCIGMERSRCLVIRASKMLRAKDDKSIGMVKVSDVVHCASEALGDGKGGTFAFQFPAIGVQRAKQIVKRLHHKNEKLGARKY